LADLKNWRLLIEYDGCAYHGWQSQPSGRSVQDRIEESLTTVLRDSIKLTAAGRTDAGVHALGQVANFRTTAEIDAYRLRWQINAVLPKDIVVKEVCLAEDDFDARRSAVLRTYSYFIFNRPHPSPFWRRYSWWIAKPLDLDEAAQAGRQLIGSHDFSAFTVAKNGPTRRSVSAVEIRGEGEHEGLIRIRISANAFLHHMVRLIVGTLAEIGAGKRPAGAMREILASCDVRQAGPRAPAKGLWLEKVGY
jgi:tRNA pseudouridine38-40 synthase